MFRHGFEKRDTRAKTTMEPETGGGVVARLSDRSKARRLGVSEEELRAHVRRHLETLMNTIRLDAVDDLSDTPHVAESVLNYGFQDLSNLTRKEMMGRQVAESVKEALARHEPRLVKRSIAVSIKSLEGDDYQRVFVEISADLIADPADVSIEFSADIDTGAGKIILNNQRI
ncbi:type VI secretion system baseplate subunit TssE [Sulfitobacter albidus]|uniref:Type VI secretion system baseplate subunit TssE n=1 Tax=Sulfitobacter albidus TaxID=2829501 RepID=A0A975JGS0_9RHOB|nr:type VI secretion system baseplate subunit TssE [Sulfitobacter albidus]QUJ78247.1 type VI secretion system baseplate subunit TssE [Sulfitobacter albidus]